MLARLFLAAMFIAVCQAAIDKTVCEPCKITGSGAKPFPDIPDVFYAKISLYSVMNKTTIDIDELFDSPKSRAVIHETLTTGPYNNITLTGKDIYNFYSNQIVELIPLPDGTFDCLTEQMDGNGRDTFMFGRAASSGGSFSAKSAFMINDAYPPVYQGQKTLESGVMVDWWKDCVYIATLDATVNVEWYFTADSWVNPLNSPIPVMLRVKGKIYANNPQGRMMENVYTFHSFRDFITLREHQLFKVPSETVCPMIHPFKHEEGEHHPHRIPEVASKGYFRLDAEFVQVIDQDSSLITDIKEIYDMTLKMSRFDYNLGGIKNTFFLNELNRPLSEIHDFNTGLSYIIDNDGGNCTVVGLDVTGDFDVYSLGNNKVRMKTVQEFFTRNANPSSTMPWTFMGKRMVRDISADIYSALMTGYPDDNPNRTSIWEVAFMAKALEVDRHDVAVEAREPISIRIKVPSLNMDSTYNIYNFDETEPNFHYYDIANCYEDNQKKTVSFELPGAQKSLLESNRLVFHYFLLIAITGKLEVTPNRVSNIEFEATEDGKNIRVRFTLLDPPTVKGSIDGPLPSNYLTPTQSLITQLKTAIDAGTFTVDGADTNTGNIIALTAIAGSFNENAKATVQTTYKLNQGAAAGVGIACIVIGAFLATVVLLLIGKVKGSPAHSALAVKPPCSSQP